MAKKLGRANSLLGCRWSAWLKYMQQHAGAKYYVLLYLTNALCLRITQAARLEVKDFNIKCKRVWISAFKKHPGVYKPLLPSVLQTIKMIKKSGLRSDKGNFSWPKSGMLFPARPGAKTKTRHMTKDTVAACIRRHRKGFIKKFRNKYPDLVDEARPIRSHSGRRHCISTLAGAEVSIDASMAFAQIDSFRVYKRYVDKNAESVAPVLRTADRKLRLGQS